MTSQTDLMPVLASILFFHFDHTVKGTGLGTHCFFSASITTHPLDIDICLCYLEYGNPTPKLPFSFHCQGQEIYVFWVLFYV